MQIHENTQKIGLNENKIIVNTNKIIQNMEAITGLDLEAISGLKERLTEVESTTAAAEAKITEFESKISGLKSDISTNSQRIENDIITTTNAISTAISTNMENISANSAAISANMSVIRANSVDIVKINNEANVCVNGVNQKTNEPCDKWFGGLKKLPLWGEKVADHEIDFEWPTPEIFARMQHDVFIDSIEFKTRHEDSFYVSSARVNLSNGESSPEFVNADSSQLANHETI